VPYISGSAVVFHWEEALYQVYAPLPLPLHSPTSKVSIVLIYGMWSLPVLACCRYNLLSCLEVFCRVKNNLLISWRCYAVNNAYFTKAIHDQELSRHYLNTVLKLLKLSRLAYALLARGQFVTRIIFFLNMFPQTIPPLWIRKQPH